MCKELFEVTFTVHWGKVFLVSLYILQINYKLNLLLDKRKFVRNLSR